MKQTFYQRYGFRILLLVFFSLAFIWMGTRRTLESNSNNVADWLPKNYPETLEYKWFLKYFPNESFIIVSWKDCTLGDTDGKLEMFAQMLVPGETIENISSWMTDIPQIKADWEADPEGEGEPDISLEDLAQMADSPPSDRGPPSKESYFKHVLTGPRLVRMLEERYSQDPDAVIYVDRSDLIDRLSGTLISPQRVSASGVPLAEDDYQTALMVTLSGQYMGRELKKILAEVRDIGAACGIQLEQPPESRPLVKIAADSLTGFFKEIIYGRDVNTDGIILGGPPVDNVAIDYEGQRTLVRLAVLCAIFGFCIAYACFRSVRLTCFVFWASILAAGVSMALVTFTGSTCDAILLSMPALVYVLTMSGAIHIINYYHDAIREEGLKGAAERAISHAWYPCSIASLTTAFGLLSLYLAALLPIQKFGIYGALGVGGGLCFLFFYLPSLLHYYPSRDYAKKYGGVGLSGAAESRILRFWRWFGGIVIRHNKFVALFCVGLMIFFGYGLTKVQTSVKLMRFFAEDSEIIQHYEWLEGRLGPLVPMEIVICFDNDQIAMHHPGRETGGPTDFVMGTPDRPVFTTLDRMRLVDEVCKVLKEKMPDDIGGVMSAATFGPPIGSLPPPGTRRPAGEVARDAGLTRGIDNARGSMREYLAIDADPTFSSQEDDRALSLTSKNPDRGMLLVQLGLAPEEADRLEAAGVDSVQKMLAMTPEKPVKGLSAEEQSRFQARARSWFTRYDYRSVLATLGFTEEDAMNLRKAGIDSLDDILKTPAGQSVPGIVPEKMAFYRDRAARWQQEYGVDLWRINLRVWSLKKDIDYKEFIDEVETIVTPYLNDFARSYGLPEDGVFARYTGMVKIVYKTQHELLSGLVLSLITAFVTIAIVMMCVLRSFMAGLLSMVPNVFPVVIVFGFMGITGILVDVGTMMTASVAMGIAVDDTIHYLTWFRDGLDRGLDPKAAASEAYERCATAMTQTTLIGGLGLSAFAFSTFTPTQMFGIMMLTLLTVAMIGDLLFLPAILTGPVGKFFKPRRKVEAIDAVPETTEPAEMSESPPSNAG